MKPLLEGDYGCKLYKGLCWSIPQRASVAKRPLTAGFGPL